MTIEQYIEQFSEGEDPLLAELRRATNLRAVQPQMVSGAVQGAFLRLLVEIFQPRRVLEIGTFTGYSALAMAAGLAPDGVLHTVEIDDELQDLSQSFFDRSPHGGKIRLHIGSALEVVPRLVGEPFDLVFIDGDKREYPDYLRMLAGGRMVRKGGILLADNVLWYGKVAEPNPPESDRHTAGIVEFNRLVSADPRLENVILPLRDGLNLIRIK